jgi:hypothetical protein
MKPWRAAETSATASGKRTRIASRIAIACSSGPPWAVNRRVQRQRRELFALRLLDGLGLLLSELTKAAQQILGIAAERETLAAFHDATLASRNQSSGTL